MLGYFVTALLAFAGGYLLCQFLGPEIEKDVTGEIVKIKHNGVEFFKRHNPF